MASPRYLGYTGVNNAGSLSVTINKPAEATTAGDLMVLQYQTTDNVNLITFPAGWTLHNMYERTNYRIYTAWKRHSGSEPASYAITKAANKAGSYAMGALSAWRSVIPVGNPIDVYGVTYTSVATYTPVVPSVDLTVEQSTIFFSSFWTGTLDPAELFQSSVSGHMWERYTQGSGNQTTTLATTERVLPGPTGDLTYEHFCRHSTQAPLTSTQVVMSLIGDVTVPYETGYDAPAAVGYSNAGVITVNKPGSGTTTCAIVTVTSDAPDGIAVAPTNVYYDAAVNLTQPLSLIRSYDFGTGKNISLWMRTGIPAGTGTAQISVRFEKRVGYSIAGHVAAGVNQAEPVGLVKVYTGVDGIAACTIPDIGQKAYSTGLFYAVGYAYNGYGMGYGWVDQFSKGNDTVLHLERYRDPNSIYTSVYNEIINEPVGVSYTIAGPYQTGTGIIQYAPFIYDAQDDVINNYPIDEFSCAIKVTRYTGWSTPPAFPCTWGMIAYELNMQNTILPPREPAPVPTPGGCTLPIDMYRADHYGGGYWGVNYMSQLVELEGLLGFAYSGHAASTPQTEHEVYWEEIYFRTYNPLTKAFSAPVIVEPAAPFEDPAGNGDGRLTVGSYWDYPQLVRIPYNDAKRNVLSAGSRLVLAYGRKGLGGDWPTFDPADNTINGGGIFVRESTNNGQNWSAVATQLADVTWAISSMATDGVNVWLWAQKHDTSLNTTAHGTFGHYDAPQFDVRLYKRNGEGSWTMMPVYTARPSQRVYDGIPPYYYSTGVDGLDTFTVPRTNALVINDQIGMIFGLRGGVAATTNPLTGPGTLGSRGQGGLVCWRTVDGGSTWAEIPVGGVSPSLLPGSMEGLALRARVTPTGRIYVAYKRFSNKVYVYGVTSSGAGNRTLTANNAYDLEAPAFHSVELADDTGGVFTGGELDGNPMLQAGTRAYVPTGSGSPWDGSSFITATQDLTGAIVNGKVRGNLKNDPPNGWSLSAFYYYGVAHSDDNGATWVDDGIATQDVTTYNPQLLKYWDWDSVGASTMALDAAGYAYILGLNQGMDPAVSIFKSTLPVDTQPAVFEYYGCFGTPTNRWMGGWYESDALVAQDGKIYELQQFEYANDTDPQTGREELWIIGYLSDNPGGGGEPGVPEPVPSYPLVRAKLVFEGSRHPAGNPTIRRVGT